MDEVRKSIKMFIEDISNQIEDKDYSAETSYQDGNTEYQDEDTAEENNDLKIDKNQFLINLTLALSKAEIKPYKDTSFLAQMFVDTQEKKDIIDSIRKKLTQFIMRRTHYPHMKLEVIALNPDERKITATTPVERFRVLMKTAPAINLLKENFKCEIKY
ncbi:MAG: hypothetical protein IJ759_01515 [Bacteroidales bacterium]|nr:hypothetical protein [Bacteroidales bacterium]